jgi:MFS family permease
MVSFGGGEVLGCFFIGLFIDKIGSKISAVVNILILVVVGGISILFLQYPTFNVYIAHFMCFFWGF